MIPLLAAYHLDLVAPALATRGYVTEGFTRRFLTFDTSGGRFGLGPSLVREVLRAVAIPPFVPVVPHSQPIRSSDAKGRPL